MILRIGVFIDINLTKQKLWYNDSLLVKLGDFTCSDKAIKRR